MRLVDHLLFLIAQCKLICQFLNRPLMFWSLIISLQKVVVIVIILLVFYISLIKKLFSFLNFKMEII